jgi:hypothetical protein
VLAEQVSSRDDLAVFVRELAVEATRADWENGRLDRFLEAMSSWIGDMDGWFRNRGEPIPASPDWRLIAQMLSAATVYE